MRRTSVYLNAALVLMLAPSLFAQAPTAPAFETAAAIRIGDRVAGEMAVAGRPAVSLEDPQKQANRALARFP